MRATYTNIRGESWPVTVLGGGDGQDSFYIRFRDGLLMDVHLSRLQIHYTSVLEETIARIHREEEENWDVTDYMEAI